MKAAKANKTKASGDAIPVAELVFGGAEVPVEEADVVVLPDFVDEEAVDDSR